MVREYRDFFEEVLSMGEGGFMRATMNGQK